METQKLKLDIHRDIYPPLSDSDTDSDIGKSGSK